MSMLCFNHSQNYSCHSGAWLSVADYSGMQFIFHDKLRPRYRLNPNTSATIDMYDLVLIMRKTPGDHLTHILKIFDLQFAWKHCELFGFQFCDPNFVIPFPTIKNDVFSHLGAFPPFHTSCTSCTYGFVDTSIGCHPLRFCKHHIWLVPSLDPAKFHHHHQQRLMA